MVQNPEVRHVFRFDKAIANKMQEKKKKETEEGRTGKHRRLV